MSIRVFLFKRQERVLKERKEAKERDPMSLAWYLCTYLLAENSEHIELEQ
jgi:hypothetical protein